MNWLETIHQICDLREPLTFHNDKSTDHGFLGKPRRPVAALGSVSRSTLWRMLHKEK